MRAWRRAFTAEGLNMERLIRQAAEDGIPLTGVRRQGRRKISGYVVEDDLPWLMQMAQSGGWKFHAGNRQGAGHALDMLRKQRFLAACAILAVGLLIAAMQIVWNVEVRDAGIYEADIRQYLAAADIRPLRWKREIDPAALRDSLEWRYPEVAWIECGWRGMTLNITVMEGQPSGETLTHAGSGDVIALRDGIIDSVITVAGTPKVSAGDVVRKGDVLILGEERTAEGGIRPVSARGKVYARVWEGAEVRMSMVESETIYTGRQQQTWTVTTPWFSLWRMKPSGFEQQDVSVHYTPLGGLFFPLVFRMETRHEADIYQQERDRDELRKETEEAALRKLQEKIGIGDEFLTKWVDYSMIDDELLCAVAFGERVIDIGRQWPHDTQ